MCKPVEENGNQHAIGQLTDTVYVRYDITV